MSVASSWPALQPAGVALARAEYRHAIWGKFRGSREDFGWIGRSPSFGSGGVAIETRLSLGTEDELDVAASFWRIVGERCFAIYIYRSPAVDEAGRRGLEKQFVEFAPANLPRAGWQPRACGSRSVWRKRRRPPFEPATGGPSTTPSPMSARRWSGP